MALLTGSFLLQTVHVRPTHVSEEDGTFSETKEPTPPAPLLCAALDTPCVTAHGTARGPCAPCTKYIPHQLPLWCHLDRWRVWPFLSIWGHPLSTLRLRYPSLPSSAETVNLAQDLSTLVGKAIISTRLLHAKGSFWRILSSFPMFTLKIRLIQRNSRDSGNKMNFQKKATPEGESHWEVRLWLPSSVLPSTGPDAP